MAGPVSDPRDTSWPSVSVVIPVYNDVARLILCLEALRRQTYPGAVQIIVVDNGSSDSLAPAKDAFPEVVFLFEATPGSYSARNRALIDATGEVLAFTDADCRPHEDWLRCGVRTLLNHPGCGLVGGRIVLQQVSPGKMTIPELYDMAAGLDQEHSVREGGHAATANLFTTRKVMEAVGPFNSRQKSGGDREWGQRTTRLGYPAIYADDAVVFHPARASYADRIGKTLRRAGGERDRFPDWGRCLRILARNMLPPRRTFRKIMALPSGEVPFHRKLAVMAFAYLVRWIFAGERLRLQLMGGETRRS